jgi:hypothetical protein
VPPQRKPRMSRFQTWALRFVLVILKAARAVDAILLASVTDAAEAEGVLGMEGSLASTQQQYNASRRRRLSIFGSPGHIFGHEGRHEP